MASDFMIQSDARRHRNPSVKLKVFDCRSVTVAARWAAPFARRPIQNRDGYGAATLRTDYRPD